MKKRIVSIILIAFLVASLLGGCLSNEKPEVPNSEEEKTNESPVNDLNNADTPKDQKVIKISFAGSDTHPITKTLEEFEKQFEEKTQRRYDIQIFANAALGDDLKATEQVKAGMLDAVVTSPSPVGTIVKEVMVFDLPFLFSSEEAADKILSGDFASYLDNKMLEKGLVNVAWYEDGFRHLTNSKKVVVSPEDVKGMKIRTMENPIHLAAWKTLGANPTPMPYTEVFTALQQHVIDGQENPYPTIYDGKFYEVQDHLSTTGHVYSPFIFIYSKKLFDKLPEDDQKIFKEVAKETEPINRKINRAAAQKCRETMEANGLKVTELTLEQKQIFQEILIPIWDDFTDIFGEEALDMLKQELEKTK
ncbi:DctP family TRAP transporter solute-binding subunit [Petroclostridium sp. X23]|uniref:DctP family TRAP transporter solute-binding subunit n=1 Tax=Petroclostridium sp. X23 TaxID=3045146 RepID=UPI0024ADC42B|nr:DctP family TRAP transporter solute-binding subunit [Petroclostridium sp. X23]WHH57683.1 DctP family TRAP transporter solute-binding subunit [Petroclostridium sp. X23]